MRDIELFRGNNDALISSISALLALDAKGALAPNGIGEMARNLLETCAARLPADQNQSAPKCKACGDTGVIDDKGKDELPSGHFVERGLVECTTCTPSAPVEPAVLDDRTSFEAAFPVPAWAEWSDSDQSYLKREDHICSATALAMYRKAWQAWQGARAGLTTWKRRAIEAESKLRTYDPRLLDLGAQAMDALFVEPKPKEYVLTKCKLCDQLQADITTRDQRLDQFEQVMQKVATLRGTLDLHGLREEVEALLWPDLHSRPEERGTPEAEPCSGCGTPGWAAACDKCVPY